MGSCMCDVGCDVKDQHTVVQESWLEKLQAGVRAIRVSN